MVKKNITIDDLAVMVQKGFNETAKGFNETAKKADMDIEFEKINKRFNKIDERFNKIENLILSDHKKRIEKLEDELKEIKGTLAVILK